MRKGKPVKPERLPTTLICVVFFVLGSLIAVCAALGAGWLLGAL